MATNIPYSIAANAEEFLLGIAAEEAANTKEKEKAVKRLESELTRIREKLRDSYDALIPNVLVADSDVFTNLIVNKIIQNPEKFYDDPATASTIIKNFGDTSSSEYKNLRRRVQRLLYVYHSSLLKNQNSNNPIQDLNNLTKDLFKRTSSITNNISARILGVGFGKSIRKVFGNKSVLAAVDPGLGSSNTVFVFFSSSFNSIGPGLRDKVYTPLIGYLRGRLLGGYTETRGDLTIGSIVNIGHAALVNEIGSYVNSPAFAKSLFVVAKGGSSKFAPNELQQAAAFFKKESKIVENKIIVSKNFTSTETGYGALLALGVTFTNFEDAVINSDRGRRFEGPATRAIGDIKATKLTNKQRETIVNKLFRVVLRTNPLLGKSGKNYVEFLEDLFTNTLKGRQTRSVKHKTEKKVSYKKDIYTAVDKSINPKRVASIPTKSIPIIDRPVIKQETDLFRLLLEINNNLKDQVKRNMGTGNRADILNYRTGRFAESVKVEKLSESRQGMITAFYSYMKYPYATFSQGGRQEIPRSRDPKLLISKSIREIAATLVGNRMRAVSL